MRRAATVFPRRRGTRSRSLRDLEASEPIARADEEAIESPAAAAPRINSRRFIIRIVTVLLPTVQWGFPDFGFAESVELRG